MSNATVKAMAEKRVRRQKIFIVVGAVVLLAVLGFELPKLLGGNGNSAVVEAVTTISPNAAGTPPVALVGTLPNTDRVVVVRGSSQLISFGLFKSKDPFVQQLTTAAAETTPAPAAPTPPASPTPTTTSGVVPVPPSTPPSGSPSPPGTTTPGPTPPGPTPPTTPPPVPTSALISTNGVCEQVTVKSTFPASESIFRLVSIAKDGKSVQLGIVGGSFDSGQPTATLKLGEKITLVNTADGTRYVIQLETKCNTVAPPSGTTTSQQPVAPTPSTTDTTTTTPTTTATKPIVTDSLDTSTPTG